MIPWAFFALSTYLLVAFVIGRALAEWDAPGAVLALATMFVGVIWASILAAAVSTVSEPRVQRAVAPLLRTRGLAALGVVSIVICAALVYALRS